MDSKLDFRLQKNPATFLFVPVFLGIIFLSGCVSENQASSPDILRVSAEAIVQTDPAFISSDSEVMVANAVYDYLIDVDENNQIQPRLAKDWTVSDDGLTYTFSLAEGVHFHDGSPLSPEDIVWTFNRLRDPESGLPTVDIYSKIRKIEVSGTLEVTFTLDRTNPFFLYDLSDNHALILKAGEETNTTFNGTGPFKVKNYSPEDRIELVANEDYFIEGIPKLDGIEMIFFSEETAEANALQTGQIDLITQISIPLFKSLQNENGIITFSVLTNAFPVIRIRADQPPGDDFRVVQAIKHAINREEIFQLVQQGYGVIGRDTPIGPLYSDLLTEAFPLPEQDLEEARKLLEQAGYGDGLDLTLRLPEAQNFPDLAVVLKEQLSKVGINVQVSVEPESIYYGDNGWLEAVFGITGWGSRAYPQFYLDVMLTCDAKWNESHFCDTDFDNWVSLAGTTMDEDERIKAYREIQRILIERGPLIVPFFFPQLGAMSDRVHDFHMKPFPGRSDFRYVTLSVSPSGQ
jgi:peptide/nickel transport system substrate-binding protein